ncbi:unnamed protein product [Periconia digitata]|uniref:Uncharacterized protein n=1 Tax=Periconia digitata TaxID=1303443 RepID=A0A9W4U5L7_9PLEO|nr:unnamed protein product [Periconia digitata]
MIHLSIRSLMRQANHNPEMSACKAESLHAACLHPLPSHPPSYSDHTRLFNTFATQLSSRTSATFFILTYGSSSPPLPYAVQQCNLLAPGVCPTGYQASLSRGRGTHLRLRGQDHLKNLFCIDLVAIMIIRSQERASTPSDQGPVQGKCQRRTPQSCPWLPRCQRSRFPISISRRLPFRVSHMHCTVYRDCVLGSARILAELLQCRANCCMLAFVCTFYCSQIHI